MSANAFTASGKESVSPLLPGRCRLALGSMLLLRCSVSGMGGRPRFFPDGLVGSVRRWIRLWRSSSHSSHLAELKK
jgi:hypothetical protein